MLYAARRALPVEPGRSLDAIHLATAGLLRAAVGELTLLSLDERIRTNAAALGYRLLP